MRARPIRRPPAPPSRSSWSSRSRDRASPLSVSAASSAYSSRSATGSSGAPPPASPARAPPSAVRGRRRPAARPASGSPRSSGPRQRCPRPAAAARAARSRSSGSSTTMRRSVSSSSCSSTTPSEYVLPEPDWPQRKVWRPKPPASSENGTPGGEQQLADLEPGSPRSGLLEVGADLLGGRRAHVASWNGEPSPLRTSPSPSAPRITTWARCATSPRLRRGPGPCCSADAERHDLAEPPLGALLERDIRARLQTRVRAEMPGRRTGARRPRSRAGGFPPRVAAARRDSGRGFPQVDRRLAHWSGPTRCGVNGRSSSSPGWMIPTWASGTSFQAPARSPSGSETTTRVSSESPASSAMSG